MISGSKIALARKCAWWTADGLNLPATDSSDEAEAGIAFHRYAEIRTREGRRDGFNPCGESFEVWWGRSPARRSWHGEEIAFAYNPESGSARTLHTPSPRDYSGRTATETFCGTADLVALTEFGLLVVDYKTGQGPHTYREHRDQLEFLALAASRALGCHDATIMALHVTPEHCFESASYLDELDLSVIAYNLQSFARQIDTSKATPGLHCDEHWCPGRPVCPATRALLTDAGLSLTDRTRLPIVGPITNNEQAISTLVGLDLLEAWIAHRRKTVKEWADVSPVHGPDGRRWGPREVTKEIPILEVSGAVEALKNAIGDDVAEAAIERSVSTSWDAIGKAIRERKAAGGSIVIKDEEQAARQALRDVGALKKTTHIQYSWKKAKEEKSC